MSSEMILTVIGSALLIFGAAIILSAAIGVLKLPDVFTQTSAIGTAAGLGVSLMIVGVVVIDFSVLNLIKGIIAIIAQLITSAIGSFVLARASYMTGSKPVSTTVPDELSDQANATN
ncbi:MAG TPA: monovalent cation/H(+) antiporter subunit G [Aquiluna sp.]